MKAVKKIAVQLLGIFSVAVLAMMIQMGSVRAADEASHYGNLSDVTTGNGDVHPILNRVQGTVIDVVPDGDCFNIIVKPTNVKLGDVDHYVTLRVCNKFSSETVENGGGLGCPICAHCLETCLEHLNNAMSLGIKVRFYTLTDPNNGHQYIQGYLDNPDDLSTCHCFDVLGQ